MMVTVINLDAEPQMPRFVPYLPPGISVGAAPGPIKYPTSNSVSVFLIFSRNGPEQDHEAFQYPEGISVNGESYFWPELV